MHKPPNNSVLDVQRLRQELDASVTELHRVRSSVRFQLGEALVEAVGSPAKIIHLPSRILRLVKMARRTKLFYRIAGAMECGLSDDLPGHLQAQNIGDAKTARHLLGLVTKYNAQTILPGLDGLQTTDPIVLAFIGRAKELAGFAKEGLALPKNGQSTPYKPSPKKILYALHSARPLSINGYTIRSHEVIGGLKENGFDIIPTVRASAAPDVQNGNSFFAVDELQYYRLSQFPPNASIAETVNAYAKALEEACLDQKSALIHGASNWTTGLAGLVAARRLGIPFIYEVRGFWELTRASVEPSYVTSLGFAAQKTLESSLAQNADHVFTLSEPMKGELAQRGVDEGRITITPNGVKTETRNIQKMPFSLEGEGPVIGFIGSVTPYEGLETLLRAVCKLRAENIAVRMLIVGDGPALPGLKTLANDLGMASAITFTGRVEPGIAKACYGLIDLAVFARPDTLVTRIVEPLKPLEAMASGTAVLVNSVAPLAALAGQGKRAAIVDTLSVDTLYRALLPLISSEDDRNALGHAGKIWVEEKRNWKTITAKMTNIYFNLLKGK